MIKKLSLALACFATLAVAHAEKTYTCAADGLSLDIVDLNSVQGLIVLKPVNESPLRLTLKRALRTNEEALKFAKFESNDEYSFSVPHDLLGSRPPKKFTAYLNGRRSTSEKLSCQLGEIAPLPTPSVNVSALVKSIQENAGVQNGSTDLSSYSLTTFNLKKALKALERALPNTSSCTYTSGSMLSDADLLNQYNEQIEGSEEVIETLQKLIDGGAVKELLLRTLEDGEPENCSLHQVDLYLNNGKLLSLSYDFTT